VICIRLFGDEQTSATGRQPPRHCNRTQSSGGSKTGFRTEASEVAEQQAYTLSALP
jgi:hypothetical protein